jgi:hypothetical protein
MNLYKLFQNTRYHLLSLSLFAFISILLILGKTGDEFYRYALLTPDAGVYVSFVAAQDNPDLFVNDPLLSSSKNTADFKMFFYGQVRALNKIFGNYGSAAMFLVPIGIWIHLAGFYALGWVVFRNPIASFLTALLLSSPINLGFLRDFWGIILEPIPRFFYQGFLAFLFAISIKYGKNIKTWPLILAFAGFINYFHPLSTPPITIGVILSLWFAAKNEPFRKKTVMMLLSMVVLTLVLLPFLLTFFSSAEVGEQSQIPYQIAAQIVTDRLSDFALSPEKAFLSFIGGFSGVGHFLWFALWGIAIVGLILCFAKKDPNNLPYYSMWWLVVGILLGAVLLPTIEHRFFAARLQFPLEFEMYRGMRYIVPLLLLMNLYLLWNLSEKIRIAQKFSVIACLILVAIWGYYGIIEQKADVAYAARQNLRCFMKAEIICPLTEREKAFIDMLDVLRLQTPSGARILSEGQEVAIRFYGLRPLAYSYKDGPPFAYTDHQALVDWYQDYQAFNELSFLRKHSFRRKGFINNIVKFSFEKNANYLVLSEPYQQDEYYHPALQMIYTNKYYSIFEIEQNQR